MASGVSPPVDDRLPDINVPSPRPRKGDSRPSRPRTASQVAIAGERRKPPASARARFGASPYEPIYVRFNHERDDELEIGSRFYMLYSLSETSSLLNCNLPDAP